MCPSLRESIYRLTWRSVTRLPDIQCSPAIAGEHCSRRPQRTPTGHCSCRQAATVIVAAHTPPSGARSLRHRDLAEITTQDIASVVERLIPTPGECHALFTASRTLFRWMEKRRLIERSPISGLDAPTRVMSR